MDTVIHVDANGDRVIQGVSAGGAVTFASLAVKSAFPDARVAIGTKVGHDLDPALLGSFIEKGLDVGSFVKDPGFPTTRFELVYKDDKRTVACPAMCSDLHFDDFPAQHYNARRIHIGALCREIKKPFLEALGAAISGDQLVGVDLQGLLRDVHPDGTITYIPSDEGHAIVSLLHELFDGRLVVKGDDVECTAISQVDEKVKNINWFMDAFPGATICITSGRRGSLLGSTRGGRNIERIPAFKPARTVDETGAGDTFLSCFLMGLHDAPLTFDACKQAALFASAASSFLVEEKGWRGVGPASEIQKRVNGREYTKDSQA